MGKNSDQKYLGELEKKFSIWKGILIDEFRNYLNYSDRLSLDDIQEDNEFFMYLLNEMEEYNKSYRYLSSKTKIHPDYRIIYKKLNQILDIIDSELSS